jgi:hypothetical protein
VLIYWRESGILFSCLLKHLLRVESSLQHARNYDVTSDGANYLSHILCVFVLSKSIRSSTFDSCIRISGYDIKIDYFSNLTCRWLLAFSWSLTCGVIQDLSMSSMKTLVKAEGNVEKFCGAMNTRLFTWRRWIIIQMYIYIFGMHSRCHRICWQFTLWLIGWELCPVLQRQFCGTVGCCVSDWAMFESYWVNAPPTISTSNVSRGLTVGLVAPQLSARNTMVFVYSW